MKLNNAQYDLNAVIAVAATGPTVEIDAAELDMENYPTLSRPVQTKLPVFFKYNGKFIVLLGQELVVAALMANKAKIKGKLVSTPMLKKARIEERQAQPQREEVPAYRPRAAERSDRDQRPYADRAEGTRPARVYNGPRGSKF